MTKAVAAALAAFLVAACAPATDEPHARTSEPIDDGNGSAIVPGLVTGRIYGDLVAHGEDLMADFDALGVKAIRVEIEQDTSLDDYATIAAAAEAHGIEVLALFTRASMPGAPDPMAGSLDDFDRGFVPAYIAEIDRVLARIPTIRQIEVWNEPDVYSFTPMNSWSVDGCTREEGATRYALLATRVFETMFERRKQGAATPQVVAFSFSRQDDACLRASVVDAQPIQSHRKGYRAPNGLPDGLPADIVAIHGYGNPGAIPGEADYAYGGGTFADAVAAFLDARFADGARVLNGQPVWYTELGFCRGGIGGDDPLARQATAITRAFATLRSHAEVRAAFVYDYRDDEGAGETCGLRGNAATGFAANPAYDAFRSTTH